MSDSFDQGAPAAPDVVETPAPETAAPPTDSTAEPEEAKEEKAERTFSQKELEHEINKARAKTERKFEREHRAFLERENARLTQQSEQRQAPPPQIPGKPARENFASDIDFVESLSEWKADQRINEALSKRDQQSQRVEQQRQFAQVTSTHEARVEAMRETVPDFDEITRNPDLDISPAMAEAIVLSESGPSIALYLGRNPAVASRIANMHPSLTGYELGKLEAKVATSEAKLHSSAPAPLKPVASTKAYIADLQNASQEEYEKLRVKQGARWGR